MANRRQPSASHPTDRVLGTSPAIDALRAQIARLAPFDTVGGGFIPTVLLQGETGTGKGLVARVLHDSGPRAAGPFVEVNCAAIPETLLEAELFGFEAGAFTDARRAKPGLFEAAGAGTLFLDEIDALPLALQSKLLKVIEEKHLRRLGATAAQPVDVKVTAATQAELRTHVTQGRFRADLYYRLAVLVLEVPPLRARREDVVLLAQHWLRRCAEGHGLPPKRLSTTAEAWLGAYGWPGNVRELSHLMERVTLLRPEPLIDADTLERLCLPPISPNPGADAQSASETRAVADEPGRIEQTLRETRGNVVQTAQRLGLTRKALRYRMRRYGIGRPGQAERSHVARSDVRRSRTVPKHDRGPGEGEERDDGKAWPRPEAPEGVTSGWEQKSVAVLAIELTWPEAEGRETSPYEPWTVTTRWDQILLAKVQGFGGFVLQRAPSLWVVLFGLPQTVEQLPERAAQAALAIRRVVAEAPAAGTEACPLIRQTVHWGSLLADAQARDPTARILPIGETLALPVRLLAQAAPSEIIMSAEAAGLLGSEYVLEVCGGPVGISPSGRPVGYRVVGPAPRPHVSPTAAGAPRLGPLVGRERELAILDDLLGQAESGRGQVVALVGEAGMGKSRLLAEFCRRLPTSRVAVLEGRGLSYEQGIPYRPVLDLLRALAGIEVQDDYQEIREKLTHKVLGLDKALHPLLPALLTLFEVPVDDPDWRALEPALHRQRTLDAVTHLLLEASQQQPLALIVENLHWIDTSSQACLDRVIDGLPAARLLVVATYRPEYQHAWGRRTYYTQLRLDPLSSSQAQAILQGLLGGDPSLDPLKSDLIERTEGNPFFLEQSVWTLVDKNVLAGTPGAYRLAKALPSLPVPATVQAVLAARIDALPGEAKRLLQAASAVGRDVPLALLRAIVTQSDDTLHRCIGHLQANEFLYETSRFAAHSYTFKHALIREVAYERLAPERRRALHARIVEVLEAREPDRIVDQVDRLAHHARRGQLWGKAVAYLRQAAEKAAARGAVTEPVAYYEEALRALRQLPESRSTQEEALDLALALCGALVQLGDYERMGEVLPEAERRSLLLDDPPRLGRVASYLAQYRWQIGDLEGALDSGRRALAVAKALTDLRLEIEARIRLGEIYHDLGEHQQAIACLAWNVTALTGALERERFGVVALPAVISRTRLARSLAETGAFAEALGQAEEALRIAEASRHPFSLIGAEECVGMVHLRQGTLLHAIPMLERGLEGCRIWHIRGYRNTLASALGYAYALSGRVPEALPLLEEAVERATASRRTVKLPLWIAQLSEGYLLAGRTADAMNQARRAVELARRQKERGHEGYALRVLGEIDTHCDPPAAEAAEASYRQALAQADALEMRVLRAHCQFGLGRLYARTGRREEARAALSLAIAEYRAMAMIHYVSQAELALAQAE